MKNNSSIFFSKPWLYKWIIIDKKYYFYITLKVVLYKQYNVVLKYIYEINFMLK